MAARRGALLLVIVLALVSAACGDDEEAEAPTTTTKAAEDPDNGATGTAKDDEEAIPAELAAELKLLARVSARADDLGDGFVEEGEKRFARFTDNSYTGFDSELRDGTAVNLLGFSIVLDQQDFRAGLVRDFGNRSLTALDDLKLYSASFATEGDAVDVFIRYRDDGVNEVCKGEEATSFDVPGVEASAACEFSLSGQDVRIVGVARGGRFLVWVSLAGDAHPGHRQLVSTALVKTARAMAAEE